MLAQYRSRWTSSIPTLAQRIFFARIPNSHLLDTLTLQPLDREDISSGLYYYFLLIFSQFEISSLNVHCGHNNIFCSESGDKFTISFLFGKMYLVSIEQTRSLQSRALQSNQLMLAQLITSIGFFKLRHYDNCNWTSMLINNQ